MNISNPFRNKKIVFIGVILLIALVVVEIIIFPGYQQKKYQEKYSGEALNNCLQIYDGNVMLQILYPNRFFNTSLQGALRISRENYSDPYNQDNKYIIAVDPNLGWNPWNQKVLPLYTPSSVDKYIEELKKDYPENSNIVKSKLNNYDVAFRHIEVSGQVEDDYFIPIGDDAEGFNLTYKYNNLSLQEKVIVDEMLKTVTVKKTNDNRAMTKVERCN